MADRSAAPEAGDHDDHDLPRGGDTETVPPPTPEEQKQRDQLYADFAAGHMVPLWPEIGDLMPR